MPSSQKFWDTSSQPWIDRVDSGDPSRTWLLDPVVVQECGPGSGKTLLDVGCGEGRFCRMAQANGFSTIGIDPTKSLIEAAKVRDPEGDYRIEQAESLTVPDASVDVVLSYLTLLDIDDYVRAIAEFGRVCKPGGKVVVANVHSSMGAASSWFKDDDGNKLFWPLDGYQFESAQRVSWCGIEVVNYHRPFSSYFSAFDQQGFQLVSFLEPVPTVEAVQMHEGLADCLRIPFFLVTSWIKVENKDCTS